MAPKMARPAAAIAKAAAKVRARAKGKAKAAPKPKARVRAVRRRPAAHGVGGGIPEKKLQELTMEKLDALGSVKLAKATYYHREVLVCGKLTGSRRDSGQTYLDMEASGTRDDELLRVLSGRPRRKLVVHVCPDHCDGTLSEEGMVHARGYEEVNPQDEAWMTNLVKVREGEETEDENRRLREELEKAKEREGRESSPKKKDKKEKKKKKTKETDEGAKPKESSDEELEVGQKALSALYEATGLDPNTKSRNKILRRAKRVGRGKKKKKKKGSKSGGSDDSESDETTTTEEEEDGGLFQTERKLKRLWTKYPGSLAAQSIAEAKQQLVAAKSIPPIMTQYVRQCVIPGTSAPMGQEILSVAQAIDNFLVGKAAAGLDLVCQRLKSLENLARGHHWSVGRQLELVRLVASLMKLKQGKQPGWLEKKRS